MIAAIFVCAATFLMSIINGMCSTYTVPMSRYVFVFGFRARHDLQSLCSNLFLARLASDDYIVFRWSTP